MLDYCTQFGEALRELSKYKISLPDEVAGWLLMRRAGLTKEQTQLIQTAVGTETTVEKVEKSVVSDLGTNPRGFLSCKVQQHAWSIEVRPCPLC